MLLSALPTSLLEAKAEAAGLRLELFNLSQQQSDVEALQRNQTELADAFERWSLELDKPEVARLAPCSSRPPNTTVHMRLDNYDKCDIVSRMGAITLAVGGSDRSHGGGAPVTLPLPLPLLSFAEEDLHPLLCEIARLRLMLHHMYPLDRRNSLTARRQELFDASSLDATCHFLKSVEGRGLALVLTDGAGTILHANRAWEVLCGYKLIEVPTGVGGGRKKASLAIVTIAPGPLVVVAHSNFPTVCDVRAPRVPAGPWPHVAFPAGP